jgi:hypothetical protein
MCSFLQLQDDQMTTNNSLILLLQDDLKTSCDISEEGSPTCLSSPNLTLRKTRSGSDVGVQVSCRCLVSRTAVIVWLAEQLSLLS